MVQERWIHKEDSWAILIGFGMVLAATLLFFLQGVPFVKGLAVNFPAWQWGDGKVTSSLLQQAASIGALYFFLLLAFGSGARWLGLPLRHFVNSFSVLYGLAVAVSIIGANQTVKAYQLEAPLLALLLGLVLSNFGKVPGWLQAGLRTEYYVKTGIVLMGATLPLTIIVSAGPIAILQALIVSVTTFGAIYLAATRLFGLDKRFAACLGAGGSVCGVSAAIAIGGAGKAEKEHVSVAISLVIIWAVAMIFLLPWAAKALAMAPGPAGAWIGTSEFADAAGFAAAEAIGDERAVKTFTLMKVIGRDMFVGVWAFLVALASVSRWEQGTVRASRPSLTEIWQRFPKFIIGFFAASIFVSLVLLFLPAASAGVYNKEIVGAIKGLRGWAFTLTFLCIGLTTRFDRLASFGWKPLAAFALGVAINVPLGYWLSNVIFASYWLALK